MFPDDACLVQYGDPRWLESLVAAVREKDPLVSDDLILRWRTAMAVVIGDFIDRY